MPPIYDEALRQPEPSVFLDARHFGEPPLWWDVTEALYEAIDQYRWGDLAHLLAYAEKASVGATGASSLYYRDQTCVSDFGLPNFWLGQLRTDTAREAYDYYILLWEHRHQNRLTFWDHILAEP